MLSIRTILHPTDFSQASEYALDLACELATTNGASLIIVHVMPAPSLAESIDPHERGVAGIRARLDDLEITETGFDIVRRIEAGNPATEILNIAKLCDADLIVMGTHNPRDWRKSSVAADVALKAKCAVLTLTTPMVSSFVGKDTSLGQIAPFDWPPN
jgi:nucleotide-binding universal stress UspA family protein